MPDKLVELVCTDLQKLLGARGQPTFRHVVVYPRAIPQYTMGHVALAICTVGFAGICYSIIVLRRARAQDTYQPVLEDWIWHAALPFVAYSLLLLAALLMQLHESTALFSAAVVSLLLVFIAVHNAWDTITYFTMQNLKEQAEAAAAAKPEA